MAIEDPEVRREIEAAIAEAVSRFGMAGDVFIEGDAVRLVGAGAEVATELGQGVGDAWVGLAPELRQRRATEIARRLVSARRAAVEAGHGSDRRGVPMFVAPLVLLIAAGGAVWFAWNKLAPGFAKGGGATTASGPVKSADEYEKDRVERAQRVCDATRSRIMRGATVGPTEVEGWVVEIVLARTGSDPLSDPALETFVQRRPDGGGARFTWSEAPEIQSQEGIDTEVEIGREPFATPDLKAVRLTFKGKYVTPYFYSGERRAYVKTANAMAEKLGASLGALYARCVLGKTHHMGAWFLGPTTGDAAASLVYWIGAFADPAQVRESVLFPDGGQDVRASGAFDRIRDKTKAFERTKVRGWLAPSEGMISGKDAGPFTLTFPFADANRAARASLELARISGVGVER